MDTNQDQIVSKTAHQSSLERGRYAPSPTGPLHLGNLRTALAARDDIRQHNGRLILRMEDTDFPRNVPGADALIIEDLTWLGIHFQAGPHIPADPQDAVAPYRQSERYHHYHHYLEKLARAGLVYPCTCSRKDIQASSASAPHGADGPVYAGTCRRDLSQDEITTLLRGIRSSTDATRPRPLPYSLRLRTDLLPPPIHIEESQGAITTDLAATTGDFVILRRDALWAYQFVCAVDDALMGITRVVRGGDLLSSTPRQAAIIKAIGFNPPVYRHIALAADKMGQRLSKRDHSTSLRKLRDDGYSREEVLSLIADLPDVTD